jgi:NADH-quinone oxidoreductase subunit L
MSVVLAVLAFGAVVAGFIGLPQFWRDLLGVSAPFYDFLAPVLGHAKMRADVPHSAELLLMLVAVAVALTGIALAWALYGRNAKVALPGTTRSSANPLHKLVSQGYYFDAFYNGVVVRFLGWLSVSVLQRGVEAALTEGSITSPSRNGPAASRWFARLQSGNLQAYLVYALIGLALVLGWGAAHV